MQIQVQAKPNIGPVGWLLKVLMWIGKIAFWLMRLVIWLWRRIFRR